MLRGNGLLTTMLLLCVVPVTMVGAAFLPPNASAPMRPGKITLLKISAGDDTLVYKADWGRAARATSYVYNVRSSRTGWTLPFQVISPDTTEVFKLVNPTWDSTTFRLVVWAKNGTVRSVDSSYVTWTVVRRPGAPGPIELDSSQITLLRMFPESVHVNPFKFATFCTYGFAPSYGRWIQATSNLSNKEVCDAYYTKFPMQLRFGNSVPITANIKLASR